MIPNTDPNLVAVFRKVDNDFTRLAELPVRGWDENGTALISLRNGSLVPVTSRLGAGWQFLRVTGWLAHLDSFDEDGEHNYRTHGDGTYIYSLPATEARAAEKKLKQLKAQHPHVQDADR